MTISSGGRHHCGIDDTGGSPTYAYNNTTVVVGFTSRYDKGSNKHFERHLHAEGRSHLYEPFDANGQPAGGPDSLDRLRQCHTSA